ncbi:hypothetical protein QVD17_22417 [Tagetes erecta]|uniref:Uncharacterized protein n=1 Tax=Tagetes erecta TaxID=13708 RepID=A0AAD8NTJ3_TARER|nr:hypothetical protein QVD17_22417 [Tagetes erecta]
MMRLRLPMRGHGLGPGGSVLMSCGLFSNLKIISRQIVVAKRSHEKGSMVKYIKGFFVFAGLEEFSNARVFIV